MEITRFLRRAALLAGLALHLYAQAQGVTANEILLGQSTALTGTLAELGQEATAGSMPLITETGVPNFGPVSGSDMVRSWSSPSVPAMRTRSTRFSNTCMCGA